jgi:hypothetical protein
MSRTRIAAKYPPQSWGECTKLAGNLLAGRYAAVTIKATNRLNARGERMFVMTAAEVYEPEPICEYETDQYRRDNP